MVGGWDMAGRTLGCWKRFYPSVLCATVLAGAILVAPTQPSAAGTSAAIVVDVQTGRILFESKPDARVYPASLAKMMTLYLLFESLDSKRVALDTPLSISRHAAGMSETNIDLRAGQSITVEQAIKAIVVRSANDAAVVIAEALGGGETQFAEMMTGKALRLGMKNTRFRNASGLPDAAQRTTARDLAILARALIRQFPHYYHFFDDTKFSYGGRTYVTHNRFMRSYSGADGLKTGYIRASGFNLAASAKREGRRLIAIVTGGRSAGSRDAYVVKLLDKGFDALRKKSAGTQTASLPDPPKSANAGAGDDLPPIPTLKPVLVAAAVETDADAIVPMSKPSSGDFKLSSMNPIAAASAAERIGEVVVSSGRWTIQVGAYSKFAPAHDVALKARLRVPELLAKARVVIDERTDEDGTLYRARIAGLTEAVARAACKKLKKTPNGCLVLAPSTTLAMASH